jgi:hypothetical protein
MHAPAMRAPAKDEDAYCRWPCYHDPDAHQPPNHLLLTSTAFSGAYPIIRQRTDRAVSEPFQIISVRLAQP